MTAHNKGHRGRTPLRESQWMGRNWQTDTAPAARWADQHRHHQRKQNPDVAPITEAALAEQKLVPKLCRCQKPYPYTDEDGTTRCLTCAKAIA